MARRSSMLAARPPCLPVPCSNFAALPTMVVHAGQIYSIQHGFGVYTGEVPLVGERCSNGSRGQLGHACAARFMQLAGMQGLDCIEGDPPDAAGAPVPRVA